MITDNQNAMKIQVALWHVDGWSAAYQILRRAEVLEVSTGGAWFYLKPDRVWVHGESSRFTIEGHVVKQPKDRSGLVRVDWEATLGGDLPAKAQRWVTPTKVLIAGIIALLILTLIEIIILTHD